MVADRCEHPFDLMIPALADADHGKTRCNFFAFRRQTGGLACALADRNTLCKPFRDVVRERLAELCKVILHDMVLGGEHLMRELSVIGDEQQTCRVDVESAAGGKLRQAVFRIQQIENSFLRCILRRGDDTFGLMQQKVVMLCKLNRFPCKNDLLLFGENRVVGFLCDHAVHGYASFPDRRLCFLSGEGGLLGEKSVKAHKNAPFGESRRHLAHKMGRDETGGDCQMKRQNGILLGCLLTCMAALGLYAAVWGADHAEPQETVRLPDAYTREAWLNLYGWEVTAVSEESVRMPTQYRTHAGQTWLDLQLAQGLSPENYGGQPAVRYVYHVENLRSDTFYAQLLVCGDDLAGAMVYDAATQEMERVK